MTTILRYINHRNIDPQDVHRKTLDAIWQGSFVLVILLTGLMAFATSASADTLNMPTDIGASNEVNISRPTRGMTMDEVMATYGEPTETLPAVGDPPITRWVYEKFVVHFERQYVIYAVVKKDP